MLRFTSLRLFFRIPAWIITASLTTVMCLVLIFDLGKGNLSQSEYVFDFEDSGRVLSPGAGGAWDSTYTYAPSIVFHENQFHLFYTGAFPSTRNVAIGYATSSDGISFVKHNSNPVFEGPNNSSEPRLHSPVVRVSDSGQWEMYLSQQGISSFHGPNIWRATADNPTGPWELDSSPIYEADSQGWDAQVNPRSVLSDGQSIKLYYDGRPNRGASIGMLNSHDGLNFASHNDENTQDVLLAESDPILAGNADQDAWDQFGVGAPLAFQTENGFEMLYIGFFGRGTRYLSAGDGVWLGYATSSDGIEWSRYSDTAALIIEGETGFPYIGGVKVEDIYYVYYAISSGSQGIGLLKGTISQH